MVFFPMADKTTPKILKSKFFSFLLLFRQIKEKRRKKLNFTKNDILPSGGDKISLRSSYSALEFYLNWKLHSVNFPAVERFFESFHKDNICLKRSKIF